MSNLSVISSTNVQSAAGAAAQPADAPLLDVSGVTLQYKTKESLVTAVYRADFKAYPGDRTVLLGPSGCGKSTLLRAIGGYMAPVEGQISFQGKVVKGPAPDRAMVFQEFDQLFPWKTVRENIAMPLRVARGMSHRDADERAVSYIDRVRLTKFRDSYPHTLSGGMKQRVAIARALALEPAVLLMDEPFAALDALTRRQMQEELLELWKTIRCNMVFVTHSIDEAILVGSRIIVMSPHPGRIRAELNCDQFDFGTEKDPAFSELRNKIHDMLFGTH